MANNALGRQTGFWLQVFSNSRVNGALYLGDHLPSYGWVWPTETYLQRRLRMLRASTVEASANGGVSDDLSNEISCPTQGRELERADTFH